MKKGRKMEFNDTYANKYCRDISNHSILSRKDELALVKVIKKFKGGKAKQEARDKLVTFNLRMVLKEANYYQRHSGVAVEDLIGAGTGGLCEAIDKFNPRKFKTKLSTYAIPYIKLRICNYLTSACSNIHIPRHIQEQAKKYRKNIKDSKIALNDKELMKELDVSEKGLRNIRMAQSYVFSLNEIKYRDDNGNETDFESIIPDSKAVSPEGSIESREASLKIKKELSKLEPIEIDIITRRYLSDTKEGLNEIGKDLHITGERVRQIEHKALKLLRRRMKNRFHFGA